MITVRRRVDAAATDVWRVLADGWTYTSWMVGACRVRAVDPRWPAAGARIHHSLGSWPVMISQSTVVERCEPPRRLLLTAPGWPVGAAVVDLRIRPDGAGCVIEMFEDSARGAGRLLPARLRQAVVGPRNTESLRRLAHLAEHRAGPGPEVRRVRGRGAWEYDQVEEI